MKRPLLSMFNVALSGLVLSACEPTREPPHDSQTDDALRRDQLQPGQLPIPGGTKRLFFFSGGVLAAMAEAAATSAQSGLGGSGGAGGSTGGSDGGAGGSMGGSDGGAGGPLGGSDGGAGIPSTDDLGIAASSLGCSDRNPSINVRVNQDCTFRRQAEPDIAFNPVDPDNLVAGQNDSRVGFNQTGIDWSLNDGRNWGDMLPPFRQKLNNPAGQLPTPEDPNQHTIVGGPGTLHTYDAASDPMVAFDSQGRAFYGAIAFDFATFASMVFVTTSPLGAAGSFFLNIPEFSRQFVVVEDNSPTVFHDKPFMTADRYPGSPNRDNVYVTWTVFRFNCGPSGTEFCDQPIFGSMSTDHGVTWSTPELVSGSNPNLCVLGDFFTGDPDDADECNFDQGSEPEVLPNGDLVVAFRNGNTPTIDNQHLAVRCHPSGSSPDGTARLNCEAPTKIGDDVVTGEPLCDFGRGPEECIPGAFVRAPHFPRIAVNTDNGELFVVWHDYRNGEFDIQISRSTDGGATWSPSQTVNPDSGLDHYFPAVDVAEAECGSRVGVSYYRTERVPNETLPDLSFGIFAPCTPEGVPPPGATSCEGVQDRNSDYVLSGGTDLVTPYDFRVVSPTFRPPDGIQAGFIGDYTGLVINRGLEAHPIWADTRNVDPFAPLNGVIHDTDIFTDSLLLPEGQGKQGPGVIGSE